MTTPAETVRYLTPKLGLLAPSIDDDVSASRPNWRKLDAGFAGALWVTAGTMPDSSLLFDGRVVAERGTGIVWRAQRNVAGIFEKRFLNYPLWVSLAQQLDTPNQGPPHYAWGYQVFEGGINVGPECLVNNRFVVPVTGIYVGSDTIKWMDTANGTGYRAHALFVNDQAPGFSGPDVNYDEDLRPAIGFVNGVSFTQVSFNRRFNKGDTICSGVWSNAPGLQATNHRLQVGLQQVTY